MRTFSGVSGVLLATLAVLPLTGCLRSEVTHTIYLGPSGVLWSAMEKDVRSDERDEFRRSAEEHDYFLAGRAEQQPIARALRRLGATSVATTWLRRDRPYTVVTEGRFTDLRQLVAAMLGEAGLDGDASLIREACRTTFTVRINLDAGTSADGETALDALLADPEGYRLVLTQGRFVSADGFVLGPDGAVATLDPKKSPVDGMLTMTLTWVERGC
jgi:hypothetical protein